MTVQSTPVRSDAPCYPDVSTRIRQTAIGVLLLIVSNSALALTLIEDYELQERCGRRSEEIFRKDWGKGMSKTGGAIFEGNYNNHYNKKHNKCFYLIWSTATARKGKDQTITRSTILYDINGNKEYAAFSQLENDASPSRCVVHNVTCSSKQEFDKLVERLMTE